MARLESDGEVEVVRLIAEHQTEAFFLDFKRANGDGAGARLHDDDRKNLAKAISGFGNSEGGVVVWGVDCRDTPAGDVPTGPKPLQDPVRFASWIEGAISGCTVPGHTSVRTVPIRTAAGTGFAATLIPRSEATPLQCIQPRGTLQYYMRVGSNFASVPHAVLAGMFGRGPQPKLDLGIEVNCHQRIGGISPEDLDLHFKIGLTLTSAGPGICRDVYLSSEIEVPEDSSFSFEVKDYSGLTGGPAVGNLIGVIAFPDFRLAPGVAVNPLDLSLSVRAPMSTGKPRGGRLRWSVVYGHATSAVNRFEADLTSSEFQGRLENLRSCLIARKAGDAAATEAHANRLASRLFGVTEPETVKS